MEPAVMRGFDEIKAILRTVAERQAAAEVRMDRAEARVDRVEDRLKDADARAEVRFERAGTRETDERINALIDSQQRTEESLQAFLDSLRRDGNGHRGGRAR